MESDNNIIDYGGGIKMLQKLPRKIEVTKGRQKLVDLIGKSFSNYASISDEVKDHLISLAIEGKLTQHNSKGTIEQWTSELLKKLRERDANET
jgi:hypothetical protein